MAQISDPVSVDYGLRLYLEVFKLEALHFGLWEKTDPLTLDGLRRAQTRYTENLVGKFPTEVKRILDVINQPVEIDGNTVYLTSHVGVSLYPTDADSVESLLNNAMSAKQYSKKHKSEFGFQFYDHHVQEQSLKYLQLEVGQCCMVACHNFDLDAARAVGFKTAFVRRPDEWGAEGPPDPEPNPAHDIIVDDFPGLAKALGVAV